MVKGYFLDAYPPSAFQKAMHSYFFGKRCDHPKYDQKSVLKYKADTLCIKECPFCQSQIIANYEIVCGGHGEYYDNLYIRCSCGLSFLIRDEKSIDLWNNVAKKGGLQK